MYSSTLNNVDSFLNMVQVNLMAQRFWFGMVSTASLSLSMRGDTKMATYFSKQEGEIDMQEQTSWSSTVVVLYQ